MSSSEPPPTRGHCPPSVTVECCHQAPAQRSEFRHRVLLGLIIKEGDPDSILLIGNDIGARSCEEFLDGNVPLGLAAPSLFTDVGQGDDIQTG